MDVDIIIMVNKDLELLVIQLKLKHLLKENYKINVTDYCYIYEIHKLSVAQLEVLQKEVIRNGQCYINAGGADCADAIDSQACNIAIRSWWSIGFYDQCFSKYAIRMNVRDGIVRAYTIKS